MAKGACAQLAGLELAWEGGKRFGDNIMEERNARMIASVGTACAETSWSNFSRKRVAASGEHAAVCPGISSRMLERLITRETAGAKIERCLTTRPRKKVDAHTRDRRDI